MIQPSFFRRLLLASLTCFSLAIAAIATPIVAGALTPAQAQVSAEFQSALEPYGHWVRHARWGAVWVPDDVPPGWRPYSYGHWIYTDEWGWYWVSNEEEEDWGWVVYHYGRWAHDRRLGWFWIPGDEWGPAWVDWRRSDDYVGWAPLPPDDVIYEYDDAPAYWVFVPFRHMLAPRLHSYYVPPSRTTIIIRNTVVINRTIVVEHRRDGRARFAVNAGISPAIVGAARRSPVPAFRVNPHVLPGTQGVVGAVTVRPQELARPGQRNRVLAPRIQRTTIVVPPAASVTKPQPLGQHERGRLGSHPPRAAQGAIVVPPPGPQQKIAPTIQGAPPPVKRVAPTSPPPIHTAPPPHIQGNQKAPITQQTPPPPTQIKPPPKQLIAPAPSQVKPLQPTPPKAPPPQIKMQPAPHPPQQPVVRPVVRPPVVHQAPPPQVHTAPPPQVHRAPPPQVHTAPPPQVHRAPPPQVNRAPPPQVHRAPPPPQGSKVPPKKPGDKDIKDNK